MNHSISNDMFLAQLTFQRRYLAHLVDDIPEQRLCEQPGVANHPAWQLGHLAFVMDQLVATLGGSATLGSWKAQYGPGSIPNTDRAAYAPKSELLGVLDERRAELLRLYTSATPETLAGPNPIVILASRLPTLGQLILFMMSFHEATHLGQLSAWRRAAGMERALSRMMA